MTNESINEMDMDIDVMYDDVRVDEKFLVILKQDLDLQRGSH